MSNIVSCALCVFVMLAVSGCAASAPEGEPTTPASPAAVGEVFLCSGISISREALETRVAIADIGEHERIALSEAVGVDGSPLELRPADGWYLASTTDDLVAVMRDVEAQADPSSLLVLPDREVLAVTWVNDATNLTPGWYVSKIAMCALTVDLGDLTIPAIALHSPPNPMSQELSLLVTEAPCNSGGDAEGRIEVVRIDETDDRVSLVLGVRPRDGDQTCPLNPATPFSVTLSKPLGEREVVDAGLADPRVLWSNG